uniref:U4/U6.U5 small nuclear ribonucleoprotein 27 kDa protein n=2 Tax=Eptatretus burgeri TaxID=7764 RepID=A0A8C4NEB9_EPTBU
MTRSRSRSPRRAERRRSTSRDRERRRREREKERRRSRSRSPFHRRSRSPKRQRTLSASPPRHLHRSDDDRKMVASMSATNVNLTEADMEGKSEEEVEMMKLMGFGSFATTKGKRVDGSSNAHAVNIALKRKYRQYMNRKGGFNRPLDFIA